MSDEQGTPVGDSPPDTNWEQRFKDTQAAYTQSQQRLKELEEAQAVWEDEEAVRQRASEKFGWDFDETDEDPDDGFIPAEEPTFDPEEITALKAELEALKANVVPLAQDHGERAYERDMKDLLGDRFDDLSSRDREIIDGLFAKAGGQNHDHLKAAVEKFNEFFPPEENTTRKRKAATVAPSGKAATEVTDWSSMSEADEARELAARVRALTQSQT